MLMPALTYAVNQTRANFPVGLWDTYHYKMGVKSLTSTPTQIYVCIQPNGTWQSINSPDGMGGRWIRVGNSVHLSGNTVGNGGSGEVSLVKPYFSMAGTWQSWSLKQPAKQHLSFTSHWELLSIKSCIPPK